MGQILWMQNFEHVMLCLYKNFASPPIYRSLELKIIQQFVLFRFYYIKILRSSICASTITSGLSVSVFNVTLLRPVIGWFFLPIPSL